MKIGFIGMGKLGFPCALAIESKGHEVIGYDITDKPKQILESKKFPYMEDDAQELLDKSKIKMVSLDEMIDFAEMIFVAVQTPHDPQYEGITRIPAEPKDFDYSYLVQAVKDLTDLIEKKGKDKIVVIISTVLPTTIDTQIKPILKSHTKLVYNPFFIAMSTTINDLLNPEFVLFGVDDPKAVDVAEKFYHSITSATIYKTNIINAELIKVLYNTFIGTKIVFANTAMEICHKIGADVDEVMNGLKLGWRRLTSDAYLTAGMGDGGACHPRDNIALAFLAKKYDLRFDWFTNLMKAREKQTEWLTTLTQQILDEEWKKEHNVRAVILGKSYKPETNLTVGSPSILFKSILEESGVPVEMYDPYVDDQKQFDKVMSNTNVFFIGTKHKIFAEYNFPAGSIIIDPHRYIPLKQGIKVIHIGEKN